MDEVWQEIQNNEMLVLEMSEDLSESYRIWKEDVAAPITTTDGVEPKKEPVIRKNKTRWVKLGKVRKNGAPIVDGAV